MSRFSAPPPPANPHECWISGDLLRQFASSQTTAHRLYSSTECWVERFGPDALLSYQHDSLREEMLAALEAWSAAHEWQANRVFGRPLPRQNEERSAPILLRGDASAPLATVVQENGMRFGLDFAAGYSVGLFLDQRANRARIRRSGVRRLLNTFAYTSAFSVAAALGGAETLSVDLSRKSLDRGRENFALNGLAHAGHRFHADDVLELLPRLARKGEKFDSLVLDPPTFSRGHKGRRFQVERDFEDLLLAALELAAPKATLLLSTNCTRLNQAALEGIARFCLKATRRAGSFHHEPALPDIPPEHAARTLWLVMKS